MRLRVVVLGRSVCGCAFPGGSPEGSFAPRPPAPPFMPASAPLSLARLRAGTADADLLFAAQSSAAAEGPPSLNWLPYRIPTEKPLLRLFCFPWAGASASAYAIWQRRFVKGQLDDGVTAVPDGPDDDGELARVELCAVQMPGREHRASEAPYTDLRLAAREFVRDCFELLTTCRVAFFGHGCGAWMAYEVALELRRHGAKDPVLLVVSNWPAPQTPVNARPWRKSAALDNEELIREGRMWGWPEHVFKEEFWPHIEPVVRRDLAFFDTYEPSGVDEPLSCPIVAYVSQDDPKLGPRRGTPEFLEAWARLTTRMHMEVEVFNGDHYYLQDAALRHKVAKSVARRIGDIAALLADYADEEEKEEGAL